MSTLITISYEKEGKQPIEYKFSSNLFDLVGFDTILSRLAAKIEDEDTLDADLLDVIKTNGVVPAIKLHRERTMTSLKKSKAYVDQLCEQNGITIRGKR